MEVLCSYVDQLVDACYHKGLPPSLSEDFERHIGNCPDCQDKLGRYETELKYRLLRVLSEDAADTPEVVEELWGRFLLTGVLPIP